VGVSVSHFYVAKVWRDSGLRPAPARHVQDQPGPEFAEKVTDNVGL
jgi:hypothetical protein